MYTKLLFLTVFSSLLSYTASLSQENVLKPRKADIEIYDNQSFYKVGFGLEAGVNYNMFSQSLIWSDEIPNSVFNVYEKASGIAPYVAAIVDFPISNDNSWGIQAKLAYEGRAYDNSYTGIIDCQDFTSGLVFDAVQDTKIEISGADFGISALLRYNITNEFVISFGPQALIPLGNYSQTQTSTLLTDECFYNYGTEFQTKVLLAESEISDINTRFGIDLGLSYMIQLSEGIALAPTVRLNYIFNNIGSDSEIIDATRSASFGDALLSASDSKLHALKFGLGLWF